MSDTDVKDHELLDQLPVLDEKKAHSSDSDVIGKDKLDSERVSYVEADALGEVLYVNGEPVVQDGKDVSRFVVDIRDDGDEAMTFRGLVLGTIFGGLGAALYQVRIHFKPAATSVSGVFLMLVIYAFGTAWATLLPRASWVEGTRFARLGPAIHFINPDTEFKLKEHVVATIISSTAAYGASSVLNFAVQRLYYDTHVNATTAVLATFSTAVFGYSVVGLLRPLTVYPAEMVYWANLPTVTVFQSLHYDKEKNKKRLRLFWIAFGSMFVYEIFPAYLFPLLNGFSIVCLATQKSSPNTVDVITNIFGGSDGNEGLGLLNFSFDWQYLGSSYMALPLIQQANSWVGLAFCYIVIPAIYYSNLWNSKSFPMLSTSIFNANGTRYSQSVVFTGPNQSLNQTALDEVGLPALTGSNAWHNLMANVSIGGLIAHCIFFWGPYVLASFKSARAKTQADPHWQAMQKYKEAPHWWYLILMGLAFFAGLIANIKGDTTLPWWSYIIALIVGAFITPFSTLLYARMGNGVATNQLFKMIAGAVNPGKPVANLYFSMWSHDVVSQSIGLAQDLKMGQYLKIPPRVLFGVQMWGTIIGAIVNYVVMNSIVSAQREILLDPIGTNVWSGQTVQSLNSNAVTWALAKELYGPGGPYFIIPMGLFIGAGVTFFQWLLHKRFPVVFGVRVDSVMLPLIYMYSSWMSSGVNSVVMSQIIIGITSQVWLRRYHPGWYRKYNYILGGALDGGAQVMIFLLSFAVFGASGQERPFPSWAGNAALGNKDYCNGNGALD
ncbi:OPT superfamily oligopeptide transporter [Peniophora sp. CONT]|nr:OPT superfamily oligopeptide transporter [Peniophora sp. CONT]